ncbi:MAG: hypothetical protein AB7I04_06880 [Pseudomonadales bacterium]
MSGLVIQSHTEPLPAAWLGVCTASVRRFAAARGYDYRWMGDELFATLPAPLREKTRNQRVVATDLARLAVLQSALVEGYDPVVWMDADVLVLDAERFRLADAAAQFGREVWVQREASGALKVYRRIHNAVMAFRRDEPVLPFYRHAATRILERYDRTGDAMVPQLIGPKLLTLLHNAIGFDVLETAGVLSPAVITDLLAGGGRALERFLGACRDSVLAVNVCGSSVRNGDLDDAQMARLVGLLCERPTLLAA